MFRVAESIPLVIPKLGVHRKQITRVTPSETSVLSR